MDNDLISRSDLLNTKPEFLNEKVARDTKYQTTKDRIYAKAWNDCNSCWIDTIDNAPTVETPTIYEFKGCDNCELERPKGKWIKDSLGYNCENCHFHALYDGDEQVLTNYCPNCGADMRDKEE